MLGKFFIGMCAALILGIGAAGQSFAVTIPVTSKAIDKDADSIGNIVRVRKGGGHWKGGGGHWKGGGHRFRGGHWGGRRWHGRRHWGGRRHYYGYPFVYYGYDDYPYYYSRPYYRGGRCSHWRRRCAERWGYGNGNYYGCLRYHRCY